MLGQNFDGDGALEARVPRPVDLAHATRTEWGLDFIGTEFCARGEGHPRAIIVKGKGLGSLGRITGLSETDVSPCRNDEIPAR